LSFQLKGGDVLRSFFSDEELLKVKISNIGSSVQWIDKLTFLAFQFAVFCGQCSSKTVFNRMEQISSDCEILLVIVVLVVFSHFCRVFLE